MNIIKNSKKSNCYISFNYRKFSKRYKKHKYNKRYDRFKARWKSRKGSFNDFIQLLKDDIENNKDIKESEIPVMKRINKSLIYFIQLKPAFRLK